MKKYLYSSLKLKNGMLYTMHEHTKSGFLNVIHEISFNENYVIASFYIPSTITKNGLNKINGDSKTNGKYKLYKNSKGYYFKYLGFKYYIDSFKSDAGELLEIMKYE